MRRPMIQRLVFAVVTSVVLTAACYCRSEPEVATAQFASLPSFAHAAAEYKSPTASDGGLSDAEHRDDGDGAEGESERETKAEWIKKRPPLAEPPGQDGSPGDGSAAGSDAPYIFGPSAPSEGVIIDLGGFAGIGQGFIGTSGTKPFEPDGIPSDTCGAVGLTQYVQMVNAAIAVFDKASGAILLGPVPINTLFATLGGRCLEDNSGDPIVLWDAFAKRWLVSQFAVDKAPFAECVAVSATADATGAWHTYVFTYGSSLFPDYPKFGVWPGADGTGGSYLVTFNMFVIIGVEAGFVGSRVCAYDRAAMLAGEPTARQQCFQLEDNYGGVLPADADGGLPPPAGAPGVFLALGEDNKSLYRWLMHVDWLVEGGTTFTTPVIIPVADFTPLCEFDDGTCVPQPNVTQKLDSLGDRLMHRLVYRNFGAYDAMLAVHSIAVAGIGAPRWYEIRSPASAAPRLFQAGTVVADRLWRWMSSIAFDRRGNIGLGYSAGNGSVFPGLRFTGRLATDPFGTVRSDVLAFAGNGSQTHPRRFVARWGDYSSMALDPVDGCTFWYVGQYLPQNGAFNWRTHIHRFHLSTCV